MDRRTLGIRPGSGSRRGAATGIVHRDRSVGTPVDLRTLAGSEMQFEIDRPLGRPDAADVIPQDRHAAAVALLAQTLKDLLSAIRVGLQQPRDARLEGIKLAYPVVTHSH